MKDTKNQLLEFLVQTINGKLTWGFNDSLGQFFGHDTNETGYEFKMGHSSSEEVFLIIYDDDKKIIYEGDTLDQALEEREILQALYKVVTMLYRNQWADKDAIFY